MSSDIIFIAQKSAIYYNKKRSIELTLKKKDKVYLFRKNIKTKRLYDKLDYKKLRPFKINKVIRLVNYR